MRWDRQAASLNAVSVPEVAIAPKLLPSLTGTAVNNVVVYNSITPRLGLMRSTPIVGALARASYSMFASQMPSNQGACWAPFVYDDLLRRRGRQSRSEGAGERTRRQPGDRRWWLQRNGIQSLEPVVAHHANVVGSYKTPLTHEVMLGLDRQVTRDIAVSASYTWRKYTNFTWYHLKGVDGTEYSQTGTYTCTAAQTAVVGPCSVPLYTINSGAAPSDGGKIFETRPGYHQRYWGLELRGHQAVGDNWMARAAWSTSDHREYMESNASVLDPTPLAAVNAAVSDLGPNVSGGYVSVRTAGSGKSGIFMVLPKYSSF